MLDAAPPYLFLFHFSSYTLFVLQLEGHDIARTASCSTDSIHNNHSLNPTPRKRGAKSLNQRVVSTSTANGISSNGALTAPSDSFIHPPLQAVSFFPCSGIVLCELNIR